MNETIKAAGGTLLSTVALSAGKKVISRIGFANMAKFALVAGVGYLAYEYFTDSKKELPEKR